jgi:chromosome partitioning protein
VATSETISNYIDNEIGLEDIREIESRSYRIIERLRQTVFAPNEKKELKLSFTISQAADLVGRTPTAIREAEKSGRLPEPELDSNGRRKGYRLEDINRMRAEFGTFPWRAKADEPVILAIQNFKGGVGKSTITCHLAQYLAMEGYRICVIDCDSQGSTSTIFGVNPDADLEEKDTLYSFLMHGGQTTLDYALRSTYWDGVQLIPANLSLYNAEYELAGRVHSNPGIFNRLRQGIDTIAEQFDVVLLDPPPSLGMISLSALRAANALIVPVPPGTIDFSSTAHFFTMLVEAFEVLATHNLNVSYKFLKVLVSKANEAKSAHTEITKMMRSVYGNCMLDPLLKDSAEIDNASARLMTVYELEGPQTSRDTHNRCKAYLNTVNKEIELLIRKTWPSHRPSLRQSGVI